MSSSPGDLRICVFSYFPLLTGTKGYWSTFTGTDDRYNRKPNYFASGSKSLSETDRPISYVCGIRGDFDIMGDRNRRIFNTTQLIQQTPFFGILNRSSRGLVRHFATKRSYVTPPSNAVEEKPVVRTLKRWGNPRDYVELAKPELSALVITTGTWGFLLTGYAPEIR
eukprot:1359498-Amorphochlora_amoeboformis.AAC.2